jgi:hypothetical protein
MSKALGILESIQALFRGDQLQIVKGSEETENQVESVPPDPRVTGASPNDGDIQEAREEAQAGQQEQQMPGVGGSQGQHPEPDDDNEGGPNDNDEDNEVTKAMVLDSIAYLVKEHKIQPQEFAKAFSELEGDPTKNFNPVGKGEELLEKIVSQGESNNSILEKIAGCLKEFASQTVAMSQELAKAHEEILGLKNEISKGHMEATSAQAAAKLALENARLLPRTAPAKPAKGLDSMQVAKGMTEAPVLNHAQIADMILAGKMTAQEGTVYGRMANYGHLGGSLN